MAYYNDVDSRLEAALENLVTTQKAVTGSSIAGVAVHTGLSAEDVPEDLIVCFAEAARETFTGTGTWTISCSVLVYTSADTNTLATHRARVSEVRDVMMNDGVATTINADATEALTVIALQGFAFSQRVEERHFVGDISFDVVCYGSE
jgi:hypothetical protein